MKNVEAFVELCKKLIAGHKAGLIDLRSAAEQIVKQADEHPFEETVHPMLYKVSHLAFDIAEDYRSEKDDKADWATITETVNNYVTGNWEPTCWILSAMYGEYSGDKLVHSYSVAVRRQNGGTIIETASDEIKKATNEAVSRLNAEQTDERYLRNLVQFVPAAIGKYKLVSADVGEYLTRPYYATAI